MPIAVTAALLLAACGSSDEASDGTDGTTDQSSATTVVDTTSEDMTPADTETDDTEPDETTPADTEPDAPETTSEPDVAPDLSGGENLLTPIPEGGDVCTEDRVGGSATLSVVRPTSALDPTKALGSGVAGGIEIAAIFDTLIVYDPATGSYLPHIATSVTVDDDLTVWTVTLRDDVSFGNGEPLTAEAVKFSFERMSTASVSSAGLVANIADIEIVDDYTLVFTLDGPSASFLYVLAEDASNITNPTVVNAMTEDEFNLGPIGAGAGPYEVESFSPGEQLVLTARDNYWGGPVCIETLRIVNVPGAQASYDAFTLGELDMVYLRSAPLVIGQARDAGVQMSGSVTSGETVMIMNVAREGTDSPMQDVRLRQAAAAALDVELIDERVYEGQGIPGTALVADSEPWSPGVPGPQYDPELATALVDEVKAEGWDGQVTIVVGDTPAESVETGIIVEALLEAVGFDVTIENLPAVEVNTRVIDEANFDLAFFGISALEDAPTARYTSYQTGSPRNRTGYGSPDMDAALVQLDMALTREQKKAAMADMQEIWNRDVPSAIINHGEWLVASQDYVHGIHISRDVVPMFYDAYLDQ